MTDINTLRARQARNRKTLYLCGGAFGFALLVAELIRYVRGA